MKLSPRGKGPILSVIGLDWGVFKRVLESERVFEVVLVGEKIDRIAIGT